MAAMDFPNSPVVGEKWPQPPVPNKPVYIWDGFKWTTIDTAIDDTIGPTALLPAMDGIAATGTEANWARGDHVHPSDTSRLTAANVSLAGVSSFDITVPATAKLARLTGVLWNATTSTARLQASMTAGVFVTTSGNYIVNGFGYNLFTFTASDSNPAAKYFRNWISHAWSPGADNLAQPVQFDAVVSIARADTSRVFSCESRCGYFSGFDNWHFFLHNLHARYSGWLCETAARPSSGQHVSLAGRKLPYRGLAWAIVMAEYQLTAPTPSSAPRMAHAYPTIRPTGTAPNTTSGWRMAACLIRMCRRRPSCRRRRWR